MANIQFVCLTIFAICCGITAATPLLGQDHCTWGPSYWCSNITNAKGCGAVRHCIKAVWEKQVYPVDEDDVCKICTDMVKQARDQLESNQTQEDLKAVFEGSCKLIPLDVVSNECIKLVDEFIPELVETLASQMNPQAVCTVAGLCNNENIDKMLEEKNKIKPKEAPVQSTELCTGCYTVIGKMKDNFDSLSYENFLQSTLEMCFKLGSFSDSCATIMVSHFEELYSHLQENFNADNVCHVAGACTYRFHQHKPEEAKTSNVEITPMGNVGMIPVKEGDDVPCELCEQLVKHLRDILIANTTETEFKRVLDGLCKQTGTFRSECLSLVDQYYPAIYNFLLTELDANSVCFMAGMCRKNGIDVDAPIAPLIFLPSKKLQHTLDKTLIGTDEAKSYKHSVNIGESALNVQVKRPEQSQLPIERMMITLPQNKEICTFCQYFLHYIQVEISDAKNEQQIKDIVEKACKKLPSTIDSECEGFVEAYGNAVIALLVQEIDPSQVCPLLTLCPKDEVKNVEILMRSGNDDKPNCPLCLFAVEQLQTMLKNNKTEDSIQNALDTLCSHLPSKLKSECTDFVDTYSKQLIEMLVADFTPQEVCVYLNLCKDNKPDVSALQTTSLTDKYHAKKGLMADHNNFRRPMLPKEMLVTSNKAAQIETNEIPDNTYNGKPLIYADTIPKGKNVKSSPQCVICEFIMNEIDKELEDKSNDDQIKKIVHTICNHLPKSVGKECNDFVDKYADLVITLLSEDLAPAQVCGALHMCNDQKVHLQNAVLECAVCEETIDIVEQILSNPNVDRKLEHIIEKTCYAMPGRYLDRCIKLMNVYGESIIHLVATLADSGKVCSEIGMCGVENFSHLEMVSEDATVKKRSTRQLVGAKKCTWGPSYWCENEKQANECNAIEHCRTRVWKGPRPKRATEAARVTRQLVGANKCAWGPGYWCANEAQARECNAIQYCQTNEWKGSRPKRATEAARVTRQLVGANKCAWGPGYWCANEAQARECNAIQYCQTNEWKGSRPKRAARVARASGQLLGAKKCTWGPSYWCENEDQANECHALEHCKQRVWLGDKPKQG